jgi:hypothetical protein
LHTKTENMKRFITSIATCLAAFGGIILIGSCNKNDPYELIVPGSFIHFTGSKVQAYPVRSASVAVYDIGVGTTDVKGEARTVTFTVTSPTGAVEGTQYTLGTTNKTVTIPAGGATAVIPVQGKFSGYPPGRIDTLVFVFKQPSLDPAPFLDTVKLALGDICSETNAFSLNDFLGTYANTNELFGTSAYGPYTTTISNVTPLTATTGTMRVTNIWDNGWGPIDFTLNWASMAAKTTTVIPQTAIPGSNAGDMNPIYAGQTVAVRVHTTQAATGTFLSCTKRFVLNMQLGVTGVGYFAALYTVTMQQ